MIKRIAAAVFIFLCTAVAWAILGATISFRAAHAGPSLYGRVASSWGASQQQALPEIKYVWEDSQTVTTEENGRKITREEKRQHSQPVSIEASHVTARLHVDYRQKGLLWFSTYTVAFEGEHNKGKNLPLPWPLC